MNNLIQFIESGETGTDRSTFYNAAQQQEQSIASLHKEILDQDRELYCLIQSLGSFNDYNKLLITRNLLFQTGYVSNTTKGRTFVRYGKSQDGAKPYGATDWELDWITLENRLIVGRVWEKTPIPRLLREWAVWRKERLNNARSKTLVLNFLLGDSRLESWALKYRPNLRRVLSHAWGDARTRRIRKAALALLNHGTFNGSQPEMDAWVFRFARNGEENHRSICETLCFIFRDYPECFQNDKFAQYVEAISDPEKLPGLPYDIAVGLRNKLHKNFPMQRILESRATQNQMSQKQQVRLQKTAENAEVDLKMDLSRLPLVDILKYGYERGFDDEVRTALSDRTSKDALTIPFRPRHVAVVIDTSQSMFGKGDRKLHPMVVALSVGLVMKQVAQRCDLFFTTDQNNEFPMPQGDTDLAASVLEAYKTGPDLVLIITDGYENVSAGTLEFVIEALNRLGIQAPLMQLNPVLGVEVGLSGGIRRVSDRVFASAVKGPESLAHIYDKLAIVYAGHDMRYFPTLKQYLLGRIGDIEVPETIRLHFEHVVSLPMTRSEHIREDGVEPLQIPGFVDEKTSNEGVD